MLEQDRKWFTVGEVAEHFGVTSQTVWSWIRNGKLKAYKINSRNYRIEIKSIVAFRKQNERSNYKLWR